MRLATAASLATLLVTTLLAGVALWLQTIDQNPIMMVRLLIASAVLTALGFIASVAGRVAELRHRQEVHTRRWQAKARQLLAAYPRDALPRLSQVSDDELGVTPTRYTTAGTDTYVPRPEPDHQLREALLFTCAPYPFVVLVGDSKAGKSRTAAEAARRLFASLNLDPPVIIPRNGEAFAKLVNLDPPVPLDPPPALVWLDDLSTADLTALTSTVLDRLAERSILVATITTSKWHEVLHSASGITATARAALRRAEPVDVAFEPTDAELAEARRLYPHEQFHASIAETLVAGEQLLDKQRAGRHDNPAGHALVQAAVDARRAGITRPVTQTELRRLFPAYLHRIRIDLTPTSEQFHHGLSWAKTPVASQVALLRPTDAPQGEPSWEVLDYVVTADDGQRGHPTRPIPEGTWTELLDLVPPHEALHIGIASWELDRVIATKALNLAAHSGHQDEASAAAVGLGLLLKQQGDVEGARAAFQQAVDSGHRDLAPMAAVNLGLLLKQQDEVKAARAAFQQAIDSGHPDEAPAAAVILGLLLAGRGEVEGARAAFQQAIDSGHTDHAPIAAGSLGLMLKEQGEVEGARDAYQHAIDSGHPDEGPAAARSLGLLLEEQGDVEGAQTAYRQAIDSGHRDHSPAAANLLGVLFAQQGEVDQAQAAFQRAIDSGHPEVALPASAALKLLDSAAT